MWVKRGGAVLVTGLLSALGWVGYQQLPAAAAKPETASNEDTLTFEGETAAAEVDLAFEQPRATQAREPGEPSPFDAAAAFQRTQPAVKTAEPPAPESGGNPFAAFAPKQTAMAPEESSLKQPSRRMSAASRDADAGAVMLASNESPAASSAVDVIEVGGQSEPLPADPGPLEFAGAQSEPAVAAQDDPFAAFAPPAIPAPPATAEVPAGFGAQAQSEPAPVDVEWAVSVPSSVTQAQFSADPEQANTQPGAFNSEAAQVGTEPAPFAAPAQIEPEAKPIDTANEFAASPAPGRNSAPAEANWPAFEQQPATMEPAASPRRGRPRQEYSPAVEPAQTTSFNVPQPAAAANDPRDETLHVVQHGETYWSIARHHYGAGRYFQALAEYNKPRISDQTSLKPGMKVLVPSAETLDIRFGKLMQASGLAKPPAQPRAGLRVDAQGRSLYVVGEGDTLGEIAQRYLGKVSRQEEICRMNQEQLPNPNKLKAGMILVMPEDAIEVQPASSIPGRR